MRIVFWISVVVVVVGLILLVAPYYEGLNWGFLLLAAGCVSALASRMALDRK